MEMIRPRRAQGFPAWLRRQVGRQDAVGAVARVMVAEETRRGARFRQLSHALLELVPKGGPTLRRAMDLAAAEWRLLHLPQLRLAVDDAGRVAVLVGTETPLVRKATIASRTAARGGSLALLVLLRSRRSPHRHLRAPLQVPAEEEDAGPAKARLSLERGLTTYRASCPVV